MKVPDGGYTFIDVVPGAAPIGEYKLTIQSIRFPSLKDEATGTKFLFAFEVEDSTDDYPKEGKRFRFSKTTGFDIYGGSWKANTEVAARFGQNYKYKIITNPSVYKTFKVEAKAKGKFDSAVLINFRKGYLENGSTFSVGVNLFILSFTHTSNGSKNVAAAAATPAIKWPDGELRELGTSFKRTTADLDAKIDRTSFWKGLSIKESSADKRRVYTNKTKLDLHYRIVYGANTTKPYKNHGFSGTSELNEGYGASVIRKDSHYTGYKPKLVEDDGIYEIIN